jgi:chromosome segregation ATPase
LKVLKERESLIIDYFYKCFSFKNTTGSMRSTGFGTPG